MSNLDAIKRQDINEGVEEWRQTEGAVLIDVRDHDEYNAGHIQGAMNIPTREIHAIEEIIPDPDTKIFVYCLSGVRSVKATALIESMDYNFVKSIGGIKDYKGEIIH